AARCLPVVVVRHSRPLRRVRLFRAPSSCHTCPAETTKAPASTVSRGSRPTATGLRLTLSQVLQVSETLPAHESRTRRMNARILVVDDDTALAEMIGIVLRTEGFEPSFCAD